MKIENINDGEDKVERIKLERIMKTNSNECPKRRVNSDICYCDRAPGSSRSVAAMPHVKTNYCVETESNKAAATADVASNKSKGRTTRDSASDNKLSPVAKDFGSKNKTSKLPDVIRSDDIFTISHDSFSRPRGAESSLKKSIFSCISSPYKAKPSTVIIEELPSDGTCKESKSLKEGKNTPLKISHANKNKELIASEKENNTKPDVEKNKNTTSSEKKNKTKVNATLNKVHIANENRNENGKLEMDFQV